MNILLISYWYPPINVIGSYRPYQWAKYLSRKGHTVTVVTAKKSSVDGPDDFLVAEEERLKIVEVDFRETTDTQSQENSMSSDRGGFLKNIKRYIGPIADQRIGWALKSREKIDQLCQSEKFDFIISTFDPPSPLFLARYTAKKYNIPWLSDYRDLWSQNHINKPLALFNWIQSLVEKHYMFPYVSIATTISEPLGNDLKKVFKKQVEIIENGYDLDDYQSIEDSQLLDSSKINLVYAGSLYKGYRDPTPLIKGIKKFKEKINFNIFGIKESQLEFVKAVTELHSVVLHGYKPRKNILSAVKDCDFSVIIESPSPESLGVMTGKVFELVALGKPIIAIGINKKTALYEFLEKSGLLAIATNDFSEVEMFFESYFNDEKSQVTRNQKFIDYYNRERQVERLVSIMESYLENA